MTTCHLQSKKHLKNVGPIRHREPPHAACSNFSLPFTRCRYCRTTPLSHAACTSMSTTTSTTTTSTTRDRGDCYGPIEWAQQRPLVAYPWCLRLHATFVRGKKLRFYTVPVLCYVDKHGFRISDSNFSTSGNVSN